MERPQNWSSPQDGLAQSRRRHHVAGNRIRFLPGTPKASEITCLTLLQGPAGFKSGIGQHVIDAPLWSAGMQMVSSSLVQWEGGPVCRA